MYHTFNIGLHSATLGCVHPDTVLTALRMAGMMVLQHVVHVSSTEPTLVAAVQDTGSPGTRDDRIYAMADLLGQECIAVVSLFGEGKVIGPKPWGEFDPDQFLLMSGACMGDLRVVA